MLLNNHNRALLLRPLEFSSPANAHHARSLILTNQWYRLHGYLFFNTTSIRSIFTRLPPFVRHTPSPRHHITCPLALSSMSARRLLQYQKHNITWSGSCRHWLTTVSPKSRHAPNNIEELWSSANVSALRYPTVQLLSPRPYCG